jgi:hypothetical protein
LNNECFVIGSWPDTREKIECLTNKINFLKSRHYSICLVTHYPVPCEIQELVDYFIYEKENVLSINWRLHFSRTINGVRQVKKSSFDYHGVACLMNIRNAVDLLSSKGKYHIIHYCESDLEYDFDHYMQLYKETFSPERVAFFLHYQDNMYRTDLFSCNIGWYNSVIPRCQTWNDYVSSSLTNNLILEYWFSNFINNFTNSKNITFIKDFIVKNKWTQLNYVDWGDNSRPLLDFSDIPEMLCRDKTSLKDAEKRRKGFEKAFECLYKTNNKNPLIVEVGVTGYGKTDADANANDNHKCAAEDGGSTSMWIWYVSKYGGSYHGCDIDQDNVKTCANVLKRYMAGLNRHSNKTLIKLTADDGIDFLKKINYNNINLLYLDALEWNEKSNETGIYHLKMLLEAMNKIAVGGFVMLDGVFDIKTFKGKAELAIPYLSGRPDFTCIHKGYQFIFRKDY